MKKIDLRSYFTKASSPVSAEALKRALNPPNDNTVDVLHGVTVPDPFRPLEKLDAPETAAWIARQNKKYDDFMADTKEAEKQALDFLVAATAKGPRETMAERYGDKYIVERKEPEAKRFSIYVKDVPDYGAPARLLLDPAEIDPSGKTAIKFTSVSDDGKTMAYALSVSGQDKGTLRFLDIETGKDLGISYANFQTNVNESVKWDHDGKGFFYNASDEATKSNEVRYHKMGTPVEADKTLFSPKAAETGGEYYVVPDEKGAPSAYEYVAKYKAINVTETDKVGLYVRKRGEEGGFTEIFPMKEGRIRPIREVGGRTLTLTDFKAPNATLVSIDPANPAPENWQTILPENSKSPLKDVLIWQDRIFATYSENSGQVLKVFDLSGKHLHDAPIPPLSTFNLGKVRDGDPEALIAITNFQQPASIFKYDSGANTLELKKKSAVPIDLKDAIVEVIEATSKDGTKVPLTVIRGKDTKLDGTAATLLYGYGGFNIPLEPGFSAGVAQWVRAGGIYVQAHLRGGGEYGQNWYDGGRLENKQNVFDDMAAAGEHLIKENYTTNKRLAIQGGSNGGLLTLATGLQRPDLFGAIVSEVPVADMFRYHLGSYEGFSWKSDYGDPDIKEQFNYNAKYSPLHNVPEGFKHPPMLIKTDAHDDRVLPWHSFKMAATLQSKEDKNSITLLKVRTDGGHSGGMTEAQRAADTAGVRAFLVKTLGPTNQDEYKAKLAQEKTLKGKILGLLRKLG